MAKARKKATAKANGGRVNKSAWIRSQPSSLAAKEVVSKAKSEGITLSLAQVYTARSTAKRRPTATRTAPAAQGKRGPGRPKSSTSVNGDLRRQFMVMAVRIGVDEAQRLLDRIVDVETSG